MSHGVEEVCEAFLMAPFQANGWQSALSLLADHTRSSWAHLLAVGGVDDVQLNCLSVTPSQDWDDQFKQIDGGNPRVNWRVALAGRPLSIVAEPDYAVAKSSMHSTDYDDFVRQYDMLYGCQTTLYQNKERFFGLATLRSEKDGVSSDGDRAIFAQVAPTVLSAIRLQYAADQHAEKLVTGMLETMNSSSLICDIAAKVWELTPCAEQFLAGARNIKLSQGRLSVVRSDDYARLRRALSEVIDGSPLDSARSLWIADDDVLGTGCFVEICKLPQSLGFTKRAVVTFRHGQPLGGHAVRQLGEIFNLTIAEGEVAVAMANGVEREAIAAARATSLATVNSQIKAIFRKMDVTREAELAASVNRLLR